MVWQLHRAWIPFAWSTALDAGTDFTAFLYRSRRSVCSKSLAPPIVGSLCDAGSCHHLLGGTCKSTQPRHANVGRRLAECTTYRLRKAGVGLASPGRALGW